MLLTIRYSLIATLPESLLISEVSFRFAISKGDFFKYATNIR